jgi:hypothetical protein
MAPAPATNTLPILALVGAEIICLLTYVGSCELRAKDSAVCESRWAMALPAMALAGQSAATYFMDSGRPGSTSSSGPTAPFPGGRGALRALPERNRLGQFRRSRGDGKGDQAA